jgi:hypothetical protein
MGVNMQKIHKYDKKWLSWGYGELIQLTGIIDNFAR